MRIDLPGADNLSLGLGGDSDVAITGKLLRGKTAAATESNSNNCNDRVRRRITEPVLLEGLNGDRALHTLLHCGTSTEIFEKKRGNRDSVRQVLEVAPTLREIHITT